MPVSYLTAINAIRNQTDGQKGKTWSLFSFYMSMADSVRDAWPEFCQQLRDETTYTGVNTPAVSPPLATLAVPSTFLASATLERPYGRIDSIWQRYYNNNPNYPLKENRMEKGLAIDPLSITTPKIRFKSPKRVQYEYTICGRVPWAVPPVYSFTSAFATDVITGPATGFTPVAGNQVVFSERDLPTPLLKTLVYYMVSVAGVTFKVAATLGGTALDLTTADHSGYFAVVSDPLPASDYQGFMTYLRWDAESKLRAQKQASGEYDSQAQGQRRVLAEQWARNELAKYFVQPYFETMFGNY